MAILGRSWYRRERIEGGNMRAMNRMLLAAVMIAAPLAGAKAQESDGAGLHASQPGITFGGRAAYYRPKDADEGTLNGGAQLRLHITSVIAVEGSADYRQNKFGGTTVDIVPVQASLLLYLAPNFVASPYILGGVGWYYTHVQGDGTTHRYGPHAGGGLEVALNRHWTVDGSYRYLWTQSLTAPTTASPAGKNFSDNGFMLTAALNYRF
jgi:opacity protein-like surface antigen